MFSGVDAIKKAKKRGKKGEKGRGECCKISTSGEGSVAEMGGITPLFSISNPLIPSLSKALSLLYHDKEVQHYSEPC